MKRKKSGLGYLVFFEIVIFIIVIVCVLTKKMGEKTDNDKQIETEAKVQEQDSEATKYSNLSVSAEVEQKLEAMSVEEKVAQMFFVTPEMLMDIQQVTVAGTKTKDAINACPVGGLVYTSNNFQGQEQTNKMLASVQQYSKERIGLQMFLAVEEEGGADYSPLAVTNHFSVQKGAIEIDSSNEAADTAKNIAEYLTEQGLNMNFAPYAAASTGQQDMRAFQGDETLVAGIIEAEICSYEEGNILPVIKYPVGEGIEIKSRCIMIEDFLSAEKIDELREKAGNQGLIITGSLSDKKITDTYSPGDAAIAALLAGNDMLYQPADFKVAYQAVLDAVNTGKIPIEQVNESVGRILMKKMSLPEINTTESE